MVQKAVKELCGVSEKLTDDLDADQLAVAKKHIDALGEEITKMRGNKLDGRRFGIMFNRAKDNVSYIIIGELDEETIG